MNEAISAHLAETKTLAPIRNPAYNPALKALGFSLKSGDVFFGNAGPGEGAMFFTPVATVPNSLPQTIRLPLGHKVTGGVLTILLDLEQPGFIKLGSAKLVE
jgi:hypothetical protein